MHDSISTPATAAPLNGERLVSFAFAAANAGIPGGYGGEHLNPSTLWRWATRGAKDVFGERHRLEAVRAGSRWYTSIAAVHRLIAKLTEASAPPEAPPTPAATEARGRAAALASRRAESLFGVS